MALIPMDKFVRDAYRASKSYWTPERITAAGLDDLFRAMLLPRLWKEEKVSKFKVGDKVTHQANEGVEAELVSSYSPGLWITRITKKGELCFYPGEEVRADERYLILLDTGPLVATKAQHEPPCPRCGHKAAPEHCTEETRQEEREVAKLGAFGPFHSKEVVNVKVVKARCWNCENKWEVYL